MIKIKTPIDKVEYILPTHKVMAYVSYLDIIYLVIS